jgi:hypothetical protein
MKVVFDLRSGRILLEGDGPDLIKVLEAARSVAPHVTQIQITAETIDLAESGVSQEPVGRPASPDTTKQTMRQFARSLSLDNVAERVAALAYYAYRVEGKQSFSPKEMDGWFTMCGFQKPTQMPVALFDTKRKYGYADNLSRGNWRISNQGENLIIRKIEERSDGS